MRTRLGIAAAVAAVLLAGGLIAAGALSAAAAPGSAAAQVLHYRIAFRPQQENYVDVGTPGPGIGDMLVFQDRVLDAAGHQVGVQAGACTITALLPGDHFQTHCVGTVQLPHGQIAFQGLVTDAPVKPLAVTGGTGRYRTAAGTLTVVELGHDEAGTLTIRLAHR